MKKQVCKIVIVVGFLVTMVGLFIDFVRYGSNLQLTTELTMSLVLYAIMISLALARNPSVSRAGYAIAGVTSMLSFATLFGGGAFSFSLIGNAVMFVGAIIYLISQLIAFFGYGKQKTDTLEMLTSYKKLQEQNIITQEEFEKIKQKTLSLQKEEKCELAELKKMKKMVEAGVLTEEEFAAIKSKLL